MSALFSSAGGAGGATAGSGATAAGLTSADQTAASVYATPASSGGTTAGAAAAITPSGTPATPAPSVFQSGQGLFGLGGVGIGGAFKNIGGIISDIQSQGQAENTAELYRQQSKLDLYNAGREVTSNQEKGQEILGAEGAAAGGAGVTAAGSPALAMAKTINDVNQADVYARYAGKIKSSSDLYQASLEEFAAKQAGIAKDIGIGQTIFDLGTGSQALGF